MQIAQDPQAADLLHVHSGNRRGLAMRANASGSFKSSMAPMVTAPPSANTINTNIRSTQSFSVEVQVRNSAATKLANSHLNGSLSFPLNSFNPVATDIGLNTVNTVNTGNTGNWPHSFKSATSAISGNSGNNGNSANSGNSGVETEDASLPSPSGMGGQTTHKRKASAMLSLPPPPPPPQFQPQIGLSPNKSSQSYSQNRNQNQNSQSCSQKTPPVPIYKPTTGSGSGSLNTNNNTANMNINMNTNMNKAEISGISPGAVSVSTMGSALLSPVTAAFTDSRNPNLNHGLTTWVSSLQVLLLLLLGI